jgi:hypothetical protein
MPTSVSDIEEQFQESLLGPVKLGSFRDIPDEKGIYLISASPDKAKLGFGRKFGKIVDEAAIGNWVESAGETIRLWGEKPGPGDLIDYLGKYWHEEEPILFIGKAQGNGSKVRTRLRQFYDHRLGSKKWHNGGQLIKTLARWEDLSVFWLPTERHIEPELLAFFIRNNAKKCYIKKLPFANLRGPAVFTKTPELTGWKK